MCVPASTHGAIEEGVRETKGEGWVVEVSRKHVEAAVPEGCFETIPRNSKS
jgi:hypothetical protein